MNITQEIENHKAKAAELEKRITADKEELKLHNRAIRSLEVAARNAQEIANKYASTPTYLDIQDETGKK